MKLLQVITRSDTIGGAQQHVLQISKQLIHDGHEIIVVSGSEGIFSDKIKAVGCKYIRISTLFRKISILNDVKSLITLRRLLKNESPDVLALHSFKAGVVGRLASFGLGTRVIFTAHGWSHIRSSKILIACIYIIIEKVLALFSDKIICVSRADIEFAIDKMGLPTDKLLLIHNGTPFSSFHAEKPRCSMKDESIKLLSVVRFQPPKDFITLLEGLRLLRDINWTLTFLGDGEQLDYVKSYAKGLGISDRLKFEGFVSSIDEYYLDHDALLLISHSEGLPIAILEAMSFRLPIIASDVGGVSELVTDGENGYLIAPNDFQCIASKIAFLVKNPARRIAFGERSYEIYLSKFSLSKMMTKIYSAYKA